MPALRSFWSAFLIAAATSLGGCHGMDLSPPWSHIGEKHPPGDHEVWKSARAEADRRYAECVHDASQDGTKLAQCKARLFEERGAADREFRRRDPYDSVKTLPPERSTRRR
jgi:hypothetical protein